MPWYSAGTVAVTNNSPTVTGSGTSFSANARVGDAFRGPDGLWYEVTNVASATVISVRPNYQGANSSAGSYAIAPMQGYVKDSADALRGFVNQYGAALAGLGPLASWQSGQVLAVPGNGVRFQANFSGPALTDRLFFQTSSANGDTNLGSIANGTGKYSSYSCFGGADPANAPYIQMRAEGTNGYAGFNITSTGNAPAPYFNIAVNNAERMRILPSGRILLQRTTEVDGAGNGLTVQESIASASGFRCAAGAGGAHANTFNINWTGVASLWIDTTNVGTISLTSDHRIKQDIVSLEADYLERITRYRVVEYRLRDFGIWKESEQVFQGLIAHEAQEANPKAATGSKDAVDAEGDPVIQNLEVIPIVTDCIGAIQQLTEMVRSLQAELDALKETAA